VTSTTAVDDRIEVRSSRLWALVHFSFTRWLFPARLVADHIGVSTNIVLFWLTPWQRTDEHLPMSHIAEVTHSRGLIWDRISVESSGGLNPLVVSGLPKGQARYFVDHVRERLNEAAVTPPPQPRR
jgi:hypothetical protein